MGVATAISLDKYLSTSFRPDCDFVDGEVIERNVGKRKHGYAQTEIAIWFGIRKRQFGLQPLTELRLRVTGDRVRIPDVVVAQIPIPEEEVFTEPPYLCIEIMSPEDTMAELQDRLDDYIAFGVPNIWVVDPWKLRAGRVSAEGWAKAPDLILRTSDGLVELPLAEVLLP